MSNNKEQKTYHKKASGNALATAKKHSKDHDLKLFGSCFWYVHAPLLLGKCFNDVTLSFSFGSNLIYYDYSPFVQRVWIALEIKGLQYQYIEVDPYKKPQALLEVNPRGLVPGLRHGDWGVGESTVIMEYVSLAIFPPTFAN